MNLYADIAAVLESSFLKAVRKAWRVAAAA
jgi:hypothetical protein